MAFLMRVSAPSRNNRMCLFCDTTFLSNISDTFLIYMASDLAASRFAVLAYEVKVRSSFI